MCETFACYMNISLAIGRLFHGVWRSRMFCNNFMVIFDEIIFLCFIVSTKGVLMLICSKYCNSQFDK